VTTLLDAVRAGDVRTVQTLLGQRPSAASERAPDGTSLVMVALVNGHTRVVDALLAAGADLDVFAAAALGRVNELDILLGLDPTLVSATTADGDTALRLAARHGQTGAVRVLLDHGADSAAAPPGEPT
jgi:ankyrin repeat protein